MKSWGPSLLEAGISWNQTTYLKLIKAVVASGQAWRGKIHHGHAEHVSFPEDFFIFFLWKSMGNIWQFHRESNRFIIYIDTGVRGSIMRSNFWGREGHRLWSSWHLQYLRSRIGDTFWPRPTHIEWTRFVLKLKWGSYIPVHDDPMGKNCFNFTPLDLGAPIFRHA